MITYVVPTRDRPEVLAETLARLGDLPAHDAELVIIDNASQQPAVAPARLTNGIPTRLIRSSQNLSAGARNLAIHAADPSSRWLVMLDDDSSPLDAGFISSLEHAAPDVGVVAAEIFLPSQNGTARRESGGLPEVFIGCGAAIRTELFRELGGYDRSFDYYAEEYDLSARVLLGGGRITLDRSFRVLHRKMSQGRNFGRIVGNLVRNNSWVAARYAPDAMRFGEITEHLTRYARIARNEHSLAGYVRGVYELGTTLFDQPRRPMTTEQWDRFTGLAAARAALDASPLLRAGTKAAIVARGKNAWCVQQAARELGVRLIDDASRADVWIVGTLSPGPMLDAADAIGSATPPRGLVLPWQIPRARPDCSHGDILANAADDPRSARAA